MKHDPSLALQEVSSDSTIAFESPFGRFRVKPHRTLPGEIELWLDESCWDRYETVDAAKAAVMRGKVGMPGWDMLCAARDDDESH